MVNARFKLCGPRACTPKPNRGVLTRSQPAGTVRLMERLHLSAGVDNRQTSWVDSTIFWVAIVLMVAGFVLPGLGQIGAMILLTR